MTIDAWYLGEFQKYGVTAAEIAEWLKHNPPPPDWQEGPNAWAFTEMPITWFKLRHWARKLTDWRTDN